MPALQSLVLTDRAATPVNHTLVPSGRPTATGVATVAKGDGTLIGEMKYSIGSRRTAGKNKTRTLFVVPTVVTETINGVSVPKVVRVAYVDATYTFEGTHTPQERKNVIGMYQSSLDPSKALVNSVLVDQEGVW